jgi:hypothetical protein
MRGIRLLVFAMMCCGLPAQAWSQAPSVDYASLLSAVQAKDNGNIMIDQVGTVFAPQDAIRSGAADQATRFFITLSSHGQELQRLPQTLQQVDKVFGRLQTSGAPPVVKIPEAGSYQIDVVFDDAVIASLPFTADFTGGGDPFDPDKKLVVSGPWSQLAMLKADPPVDPQSHLGVSLWLQTDAGERKTFNVGVAHAGQVVFQSRNAVVANANPGRIDFELQFPEAAGGDWVKVADFAARDGEYELVVNEEGREIARYPYQVAGGKIKPHSRSALDYQPHAAFLSPRSVDLFQHGRSSDNYWSESPAGH